MYKVLPTLQASPLVTAPIPVGIGLDTPLTADPRTYAVTVDWSQYPRLAGNTSVVQVDLTYGTQSGAFFDQIRAVRVSNLDSYSTLYIVFPDTNQVIECKPGVTVEPVITGKNNFKCLIYNESNVAGDSSISYIEFLNTNRAGYFVPDLPRGAQSIFCGALGRTTAGALAVPVTIPATTGAEPITNPFITQNAFGVILEVWNGFHAGGTMAFASTNPIFGAVDGANGFKYAFFQPNVIGNDVLNVGSIGQGQVVGVYLVINYRNANQLQNLGIPSGIGFGSNPMPIRIPEGGVFLAAGLTLAANDLTQISGLAVDYALGQNAFVGHLDAPVEMGTLLQTAPGSAQPWGMTFR